MSKFAMSAPKKRRESVGTSGGGYERSQKAADTGISQIPRKPSELLSPQNVSSTLEIARVIVIGQVEIARIRANTEAEIKKVESEIKKIIVSTQSEIAKMREENFNWHSKFDKRQQAIQKVLEYLESHPEYPDEAKKEIIQLAIAGINQ